MPNSAAKGLKSDPRNYALLGHLDTRPRTTYLADVRNPNGALKRRSIHERASRPLLPIRLIPG